MISAYKDFTKSPFCILHDLFIMLLSGGKNRMKGFYFSSTLMWDADAETLMRTAAGNGFDGIELWAQHAETKKLDL